MKCIKIVAFILIIALSNEGFSQSANTDFKTATGIKFLSKETWLKIKERARSEDKLIFLDCYTTWCGPCKMMDQKVYTDSEVGQYMNKTFISVKVQMDTSKSDNKQVKKWYAEAENIKNEYKIDGYPTFLFLSPEGRLVYKDVGYKNPKDFIELSKKAADPNNATYFLQLEEYKNGKVDFKNLDQLASYAKSLGQPSLAKDIAKKYISTVDDSQLMTEQNILFVKNVAKDVPKAAGLARKYKTKYLDSLNEKDFCTKENLDFMGQFPDLVTSSDKFFYLCYNEPERIDKLQYTGRAANQVNQTITNEELEQKFFSNGKNIYSNINWDAITDSIHKKYNKVNAAQLVLNYQILYYRKLEDWEKWVEYKNKRINTYPPKTGVYISFELNDGGAWDAFLHCNNRKVLEEVLKWNDLAIKLNGLQASYLDTRANLLYKLGKLNEAMATEQQAIDIATDMGKEEGRSVFLKISNGFKEVLQTMKRKEPTYVKEGAVWNSNTLPNN